MNQLQFIMKTILLLFLLLGSLTVARAQLFDANLDPFQEVPPHNTPGYGSADFSFNPTTLTLSVTDGTGLYSDLLAGATTVKVQDAAVGANGPTAIVLTLDTPGNTSGTFSGSGTLSSAQAADLNAGNLYVNITDSVFPSGEIRGQILLVPEPSIGALMFGALGLIAWRLCARRVA
jgi:hypothetical protein